ncbi:hypothetical protein JNB71_17985 [Rhizobium herbae]|uniref:Uncharacterized protein n=1 Tax=Rhizobium herbae TaxID=508661 RepID=A0ABS7HD42_9HYPH|nr:hypothetical protein [Rhizobium herbae]MBW9065197.1 hypothetical protein [Rhizobium herbae]
MARKPIRSFIRFALMALALTAYPAAAQPVLNCAEHSKIVEFLGSHYSETLQAIGLINDAAILEVYVSKGGSWTILVTNVSGRSCVVFAGQNWETLPIGPGLKT